MFFFNRAFSIYEFIIFYVAIAGGVVSGIIRFIIGIIIASITFNIITEPMLPYWVTQFMIK